MMRVVTADEMRELDRAAVQTAGMPGPALMENAGAAVVRAIERAIPSLPGKRAAVFCGAGNNGGDGFVICRRLSLLGVHCSAVLLAAEELLKGDAKAHFAALKMAGVEIADFNSGAWRTGGADIVVDALLGTGMKSAPREPFAAAIDEINRLGASAPVFAVDIPSGVDSDTGAIPGNAVRAAVTVTFGYPKIGHYMFPGADHTGKLIVEDIGFDWNRLPARDGGVSLIQPADLAELFAPRPAESNKGDYGHVGIIAGSHGMAGAPALAARAAQRAGAGLVTVLAPACVQQAIAARLDEQMTVPLADCDGAVSEAAFDRIAEYAEKCAVLCIGPGLTTRPGAVQLVLRVLNEVKRPIVLDADGLNALSLHNNAALTRDMAQPLILTPHPGEAARLSGTTVADVQSNRLVSARNLARQYGATCVLKGRYSLTGNPQGDVVINPSGNPGMASGGMGDTLTGVIGGLLAQLLSGPRGAALLTSADALNASIYKTTACAVYLHGLAGDTAAGSRGEAGLIASDLIEALPEAILSVGRR